MSENLIIVGLAIIFVGFLLLWWTEHFGATKLRERGGATLVVVFRLAMLLMATGWAMIFAVSLMQYHAQGVLHELENIMLAAAFVILVSALVWFALFPPKWVRMEMVAPSKSDVDNIVDAEVVEIDAVTADVQDPPLPHLRCCKE